MFKSKNHYIEYKTYTQKPFDCECCGTCYPEGEKIIYNDKEIYQKYDDGHMYGSQTEDTIVNCVVERFKEVYLEDLNQYFNEKNRLKYAREHIGAHVSLNEDNWLEYKKNLFNLCVNSIDSLKLKKDFPETIEYELKMIILWIEYIMSVKIDLKLN
jgi:hypothetical protein